MIIPAVAFVFCAAAGIHFTEPSQGRSGTVISRGSPDYRYDYRESRAGDFYILSTLFDIGSSANEIDVDEECALVLIFFAAIALILGSIFVPHFWVLSTFLMHVAMVLFTYREWRIVAPDADM
jgi:hypothetical protein